MKKSRTLGRVFAATLSASLCIYAASAAAGETFVDPTRPAFARTPSSAAVAKVAPRAPRLTAIFTSSERSVAVIDDRAVRAGDQVGDLKIIEVLSDSVRVLRAGREETLKLASQIVAVRKERNSSTREATERSPTKSHESVEVARAGDTREENQP